MARSIFSAAVGAAALAAVALVSSSAWAAPVTWYVSGVTFPNGGTISGSFVYDADLNQMSAVSLTTTTDVNMAGTAYSFAAGTGITSTSQSAVTTGGDATGLPGLNFTHAAPLTNAGGTINLNATYEGACTDAGCSTVTISRQTGFLGVLTTTAPVTVVPTLSEWALGLLALVLAGGAAVTLHRRRRAFTSI